MTHIDYPFRITPDGATARAPDEDYVRDLIEQVLFTARGERVNRPDFGSGLLRLPFEGASVERMAALQFSVRADLERWLGGMIEVRELAVAVEDATVTVTLRYALRPDGRETESTFRRGAPA